MVSKITNTQMFPWLCNTSAKLTDESDNFVCENETDMVDDVTLDAYGLAGIKVVYYKVYEDLKRDQLYGEDQLKMIERSWYINGYINQLPPNVRSYQLQGIWGEDTITMYCSIQAFKYYSTYGNIDKNTPEIYDAVEPKIDDIIYVPQNDVFYRIHDVKYYTEAFGLAKHTYTLTLKVYKDNKWTISANSPTISDPNDPVYKIAPESLPEQYKINDPLKINDDLKAHESVNMFDYGYSAKDETNENPAYYDPFGGW